VKIKRKEIKIMGYEINSPVKQVWLPLDYAFLSEQLSTSITFGEFSKIYQKKYGIDLHDVFFMIRSGQNELGVGSKIDLVGTYTIGRLDDYIDTKLALNNGLTMLNAPRAQSEQSSTLLQVMIDVRGTVGHGFQITLPPLSLGDVECIDDFIIDFVEL
jgi:hypothetical protein